MATLLQPKIQPEQGLSPEMAKRVLNAIIPNQQNSQSYKANKADVDALVEEQKKGIYDQEEAVRAAQAIPSQLDLSPLLALTDSMYGSKLQSGYNKPMTIDERKKLEVSLRNVAQKEREGLLDKLLTKQTNNDYWQALRAARGQEAIETKKQNEIERDVEQYSKRTEIVPSMKHSMDQLDALIPAEGDIPGVGVGAAKLPMFLLPEEGKAVRQNAIDLMTAKIYLTSGKTINEGEAERLLKGLGLSWDSESSNFRRGYKNLKESVIKEIKQKEAGYRPEAIQAAKNRGALTSEDFTSNTSSRSKPKPKQVEQADWDAATDAEKQALIEHFK